MKFSIKNCLNRLKQFIKEINCCNSKCMNNTIEILNQENLNKIDALQERVEELVAAIQNFYASHRVTYI